MIMRFNTNKKTTNSNLCFPMFDSLFGSLTDFRECLGVEQDRIWCLFVFKGEMQLQIPELGVKYLQSKSWGILEDFKSLSQITLNPDSQGWAWGIRGLQKFYDKIPYLLPSSCNCCLCPQRNAAFFRQGIICQKMLHAIKELSSYSCTQSSEFWLQQSILMQVFGLLMKQLEGRPQMMECSTDFSEDLMQKLNAIAQHLEANLQDNYSLKGLSQQFSINEFKLKCGFRKQFGMPVFTYLRKKRIEHSKSLLEAGEKSVLEVAYSVGYTNPSHFARAFRVTYGINPLNYKKRNAVSSYTNSEALPLN